jgi:hypothetical protein
LANACSAGDLVRFEGFLITSFNDAIPNTSGAVGDSLIASLSASKLTGSRTLPNTVVPAGSVIQTVSATSTTRVNTTSTTFVPIGASATITPTSASSKIAVIASSSGANNNTSNHVAFYTLYRGATNLGDSSTGFGAVFGTSAAIRGSIHVSYLDSPTTTNATTYQLHGRISNSASTAEFGGSDGIVHSIILMEIAA